MTDTAQALKLADRHMVATVAIVEIERREFHIETAAMLRSQAAEIAEARQDFSRLMDKHNALHMHSATLRAKVEALTAVARSAALLSEWIGETPHVRGSINGQAAQLGHAARAALEKQ